MVLSTVYAVALAVFGGTTQPVITALIHLTGDPMAPAWYMMGATAVGIAAIGLMTETARPAKNASAGETVSPEAAR